MNKLIPYSTSSVTEEDIAAVTDVLRSNWQAGKGPVGLYFENALCEITGYRYAAVVNSGTAALHCMLKATCRLQEPRDISTSPLTFVATANAIIMSGNTPVFQDIDEDTLCTPRLDLTVLYSGYPADSGALVDAAHYLYPGMHNVIVGGRSQVPVVPPAAALSFHPVKHVNCGEGGAVLSDGRDIIEYVRMMRDHGRDGTRMVHVGYNYRLSDINAALGLSQLRRLEAGIRRRREIASCYREAWENNSLIQLPAYHPQHAWHLFVLRFNMGIKNTDIQSLLLREGIGTQIHYQPVHLHPYYRQRTGARHVQSAETTGEFPVAEEQARRVLSIPMYAGMTDEDVELVIRGVNTVLQQFSIETCGHPQ